MTVITHQAVPVDTSAEDGVRAVLAAKATAMNTQDADAFVALYAPEVVVFDLAPPLQHLAEESLDPSGQRAWFAGFDQMRYDLHDLHLGVGGEIAFVHALAEWTATPKGAAEGFTMWFRVTLCFRQLDGAWLISHEHESTPFSMDGSFRAATDLKP